jgi:hypothetical protein
MLMPRLPSRAARNSGKVSKSHGRPSRALIDMPSTRANIWVGKARSSAFVGAMEKPQLPATTDVTPWNTDEVA